MESPGGPGVTGAVKAGTGIDISADGTISATGTAGVSKLIAGSNITLSPTSGIGDVTISAIGGAAGVTTFSGGSTGLTPASPTSGAVSLGGILNIANGGTGASTQVWVDLTTAQTIGGAKTFTTGVRTVGINPTSGANYGFGFSGNDVSVNAGPGGLATFNNNGGTVFVKCDSSNMTLQAPNAISITGQNGVGVYTTNPAVSVEWNIISDERLKENIVPLSPTEVSDYKDKFKSLQFCNFNFKEGTPGADPNVPQIGLIAQAVEEVDPSFVSVIDTSLSAPEGQNSDLYFSDTLGINGMLSVVANVLLQKALQDLDDLRAEFDAYVAAHP